MKIENADKAYNGISEKDYTGWEYNGLNEYSLRIGFGVWLNVKEGLVRLHDGVLRGLVIDSARLTDDTLFLCLRGGGELPYHL